MGRSQTTGAQGFKKSVKFEGLQVADMSADPGDGGEVRRGRVGPREILTQAVGLALAGAAFFSPSYALAQEEQFSNVSADEFESRDENGVDVITGKFTIASPVLSFGDDFAFGFQWTGSGWAPTVPTIWNSGDRISVRYGGETVSFRPPYVSAQCFNPDGSFNFCGGEYVLTSFYPNKRAKLDCFVFGELLVSNRCDFTSADGDKISFRGPSTIDARDDTRNWDFHPFSNMLLKPVSMDSPSFGTSIFAPATTSEIPNGAIIKVDHPSAVAIRTSAKYNQRYITFSLYNQAHSTNAIANMRVDTPNANPSRINNSYLRPKSTTQVWRDAEGKLWRYTFDSDRSLTRAVDPTGRAIDLTYDSKDRVRTFKLAGSTWTYSYPTSKKTIVTNPDNTTRTYEYEPREGGVRKFTDETNKVWNYTYNDLGILQLITAPEGNKTDYDYDSFDRIIRVKDLPKANSGNPVQTTTYQYTSGCSYQSWCNKPVAIIDPENNRTDITYHNTYGVPRDITEPSVNGVRRTVRRDYALRTPKIKNSAGNIVNASVKKLVKVSEKRCRNGAMSNGNCSLGAEQELLTLYDFGTNSGGDNIFLFGQTLRSTEGDLTTCYTYNEFGRRVSETLPAGNTSGTCARPGGSGGGGSGGGGGGSAPSITIANAAATEGGSVVFTIRLSAAHSSSISVSYVTTFGSAGSSDFAPRSGSVTFSAGQTQRTVSVPTTDDFLPENAETFTMNLSNPTGGATISDGQAVGTIFDNDDFPDPGCGDFLC